MTRETTAEMERPAVAQGRATAGVKSILLHIQNDNTLDQRLQAALSLARACEAHLSCLHVTPIEAYVAFDNFGGVFVMKDVMKALDDEEARLREKIEHKLRTEDVSWDYVQVTGNIPGEIIRRAALADLVIVGRSADSSDFAWPTVGFLGDLLHRSRTPLYIPGDGAFIDPMASVIIAWDGSYEASNAVRAAVPLLKLASGVRVIQFREPEKEEAFPSTELVQYLSRHDVHAELQIEPSSGPQGESIAGDLLAHAKTAGATSIIMGGYNHSRIGEYLFGGVTRTLLAGCPVSLFITH